MIVYIDILIFFNIVINTVLLRLTSRITEDEPKPLRLILAIAFTVVYGFCICLPEFSFLLSFVSKFLSCAFIVYIAFGFGGFMRFLKRMCIYTFINFLYVGCLLFLSQIRIFGNYIFVKNGEIYYNLPVFYVLIAIIIICVVQIAAERFFVKKLPEKSLCDCTVEFNGIKTEVRCLIDTGNRLTEKVSGLPVIIISEKFPGSAVNFSIDNISPENPLYTKLRIIPYRTADGKTGIMKGFVPDRVYIDGEKKKCVVAMGNIIDSDGKYQGIVPVLNRR